MSALSFNNSGPLKLKGGWFEPLVLKLYGSAGVRQELAGAWSALTDDRQLECVALQTALNNKFVPICWAPRPACAPRVLSPSSPRTANLCRHAPSSARVVARAASQFRQSKWRHPHGLRVPPAVVCFAFKRLQMPLPLGAHRAASSTQRPERVCTRRAHP